MAQINNLIVLLATAAAAASVQSCAEGAAEAAAEAAALADLGVAPCAEGTSSIAVAGQTHCRLSGEIDADLRLAAGQIYQINGHVRFGTPLSGDGVGLRRTLTIEPGVTIYGADRNAVLEIARGSRLFAEGLPAAPIVFTSAYDLGVDAALGLAPRANLLAPRGEWGGVIVSGLAPVNGVDGHAGARCALGAADGAVWCERPGDGGAGPYGGAAGLADSSGAIRHIEIRYAGAFVEDADARHRRLAALTLQGVGAGTPVAFVSIVNAFGDGLALRGGVVEADTVSILGAGDDGVDWSYGYRGTLRNVVVAHDAGLGDGDNGFEGSTGALPAAEGRLASRFASEPVLTNIAVIGDSSVSRAGVMLRDGTDVVIDGAIISGRFAVAGLDIDGAESYRLITARDISNVAINIEGSAGLSADFDDDALEQLFADAGGDNRLAAVSLTFAQAMIALDDRLALNASQFAQEDTPEPVAAPRAQAEPVALEAISFNPISANLLADFTAPADLEAPGLAPLSLADPIELYVDAFDAEAAS